MSKKIIIPLLILILYSYASYSQCAMCKAAAEASVKANPKSVAKGLNTGILFLMAIPYAVVGIIFRKELGEFFRNFRKKDKALNKKNLGKLTFALTFVTCAVVLFVVFISFYRAY